MEKLTWSHSWREQANVDDRQNERCISTKFLPVKRIKQLSSKIFWNNLVMYYLCLVSIVQSLVLTYSKLISTIAS